MALAFLNIAKRLALTMVPSVVDSLCNSKGWLPIAAGERFKFQIKTISVVVLFGFLVLGSLLALSDDQNRVVAPTLAICFSYLLFCVVLGRRVRSGIFGEIGFIFVGFAVAYSAIPALNFLLLDFDFPINFDALNFSVLNPRPPELGEHLWRHCLFILTVVIGYIVARGRDDNQSASDFSPPGDGRTVAVLLALIFCCMIGIGLLSAPVDDYYSHYTRFDHLVLGAKQLAYLCLMLKAGGYYVVLTLLFSNYQKYKYVIVAFVLMISVYETVYSLGSRIETLSILLATVCLYHFNVAKIRIRNGLLCLGGLFVLFTAIEFYRSANFDLTSVVEGISENGLEFATEFGAVYYTSFHLYSERANDAIPQHEWLMLINDFFTIVPFYEHTEFNSQYWYARTYFPDAVVPPQTMGPIADSAIWGGEPDLGFRGLFTGLGYGWLARQALKVRHGWYTSVAYVFLYATSVMGLKYSLIYQVSVMLRTLVPALLAAYFLMSAKNWLNSRTAVDRKQGTEVGS